MIEADDIKRLDDRYVSKQDCNTRTDQVNDAVISMEKGMAVLNTQMRLMMWIGGVIGAAVISIAVKYVFGG